MIVSMTKRIVICTPMKTGTNSLLAALVRPGEFEHVRPTHGVEYETGAGWRRVLVVRDPYERLWSQFQYMSRRANEFDRFPGDSDFSRFLHFHRAQRLDPQLGWNCSRIADAFRPTEVWKLEEIGRWMPRLNASPSRPARFSKRDLKFMRPYALPDCERFGYEVRE